MTTRRMEEGGKVSWRKKLSEAENVVVNKAPAVLALGYPVVAPVAVWNALSKMEDLLDAEVPSPAPTPTPAPRRVIIPVPYQGQWEEDAGVKTMDCGGAAVESVGEHYNPSRAVVSTNEIYRYMTKGENRGTYLWELDKAATHFYGVTLREANLNDYARVRTLLDGGTPLIILVKYGNYTMRMDRGYTGGHWMVIVGYDNYDYQGKSVNRFYLHDPDFWGDPAQGAEVCITQTLLNKMQLPYKHLTGIPAYGA